MFPWSPWSREDEKRIAEMSPLARALAVVFALALGLGVVLLCWSLLA
jgi:hypothetical protein